NSPQELVKYGVLTGGIGFENHTAADKARIGCLNPTGHRRAVKVASRTQSYPHKKIPIGRERRAERWIRKDCLGSRRKLKNLTCSSWSSGEGRSVEGT